MAQNKKSNRVKLPGSDILELPGKAKTKIMVMCGSLKEPARTKCMNQHSRSFREEFTRKKQKANKKGKIA